MPSKKQYDLVLDDGPDSKIPLHNEDAFQHGIHFHAKYIGTLDVPRPTSRVEIVAAMRRIRHEFKMKAVKKKKVSITVSVDGVKVVLQKKNRRKQQQCVWDESRLNLLQHPIYRIFYVSHDSQDLKIFSYIARDGSTNVFRCNVFKAYKKNQAMTIVRTIGQAFEVCHRMSLQASEQTVEGNDRESDKSLSEGSQPPTALQSSSTLEKPVAAVSSPSDNGTSTSTQSPDDPAKQGLMDSLCIQPIISSDDLLSPVVTASDGNTSSSSSFLGVQFLRHQLELQTQQTQFLVSQVQLIKDQLAAETAARSKAQALVHQLLAQNRDLLMCVNSVVSRISQLESSSSSSAVLDASIGSMLDPSLLFTSASSNMNDSSSFHSANYDTAVKLTSLGNQFNNEMTNFLASDNAESRNVDSRGHDIPECTTSRRDASNQNEQRTTGAVDLLNGIAVNNIFCGSETQNGESKKNGAKVCETPVERNRLDVAPKLDPPPKVNRNSFRVPDPSSNGRPTILNPGHSEADFADVENSRRHTNGVERRHNWDNFVLSENKNHAVVKELAVPPRVSCSDGNGNDCDSTEPLHVGTVQGSKGIRNCFVIQHQNSVDSTSKLKLSFSDNE